MSGSATNRGLPPLDWLRVFEAAGRHGNFTAAAEEFGTSQAAISQRIRNLETWLGRKLFIRAARGVSLTVDGESYLPLVQDALTALAQGTEDLFTASPHEMRIAGLDSHLTGLLLPRISSCLEGLPNIRLVTDTVPKRSDFEDEKTAFHIRFGRGKWPGRITRLLHQEELQPMVAGGFDGDWRERPIITVRGERPGWQEWSSQGGVAAPRSARLSFDSMGHGLVAAVSGQGVVLGSTVLGAHLIASGALKPCSDVGLTTDQAYWLSWPETFTASPKRKALADRLTEVLRAPPCLPDTEE